MSKDDKSPEAFGATPQERPVPRISIHAFCEFPDTGAALQRAGADRRVSKAHLTVQSLKRASAARPRWTNSIASPKSAIPPPKSSWWAVPTTLSSIAT